MSVGLCQTMVSCLPELKDCCLCVGTRQALLQGWHLCVGFVCLANVPDLVCWLIYYSMYTLLAALCLMNRALLTLLKFYLRFFYLSNIFSLAYNFCFSFFLFFSNASAHCAADSSNVLHWALAKNYLLAGNFGYMKFFMTGRCNCLLNKFCCRDRKSVV